MRLAHPLTLLLALAMSGCVVGDESLPTDEDLPPEGSEAALSNNVLTAYNYFVAKGFSDVQSAGIVGNLMQESSVSPTAVEFGGGPGRGIAQWSIGGRWNSDPVNLVRFANARGASRWALRTQLDFIWHELSVVGGFGLADLRAATTVKQAVLAFQNKFERCGTCAQGNRVTYANEVLAEYGGGASGGGTPAGSGESCYSATLGRTMPEHACVQSSSDGEWYQCADGSWVDRWSNPNQCNGEYPN